MGIFGGSSEETNNEKNIDTAGDVNNNIIIQQEAKDVHNQLMLNQKMLIAAYCLVFFEVVKLGIYLYTQFRKNLKKRYGDK